MSALNFTKKVIATVNNDVSPAAMNTFSAVGDINNDGKLDVTVCGRNGKMVWLENKGVNQEWEEHLIDNIEMLECGGSIVDLTGNGYPDIINGGDWRCTKIFWWENTGRKDSMWQKREIADTTFGQFHDTIIGDITGDGTKALIFSNQLTGKGTNIYYIPIPENPKQTPWPGIRIVAEGKKQAYYPYLSEKLNEQPEEGLAIGDIDGDGINELVCGTHWYKYNGENWKEYKFATDYITTKIAIGDIDGDGKNEIVLCEGDPCIYGKTQGGKLSWFKPKEDITQLWEENIMEDKLLDAHSLQVGDLCGNKHMDIFAGEVGMAGENEEYLVRMPRIMIFENDGHGNFTKHIIDERTGIHEAVLADMRNIGVLDIVGKPLHGKEKWNVHVYFNNLNILK